MAATERHWVLDTSTLWSLVKGKLLSEVVRVAKGRLHVTPAVVDDLRRNVAEHPFLAEAITQIQAGEIDVVQLTVQELRRTVDIHQSLWQRSPRDTNDLGEAEVIAVASHRGWNAAIDDRQGRRTMEYRYPQLDCVRAAEIVLGFVDEGLFDMDEGYRRLGVMDDPLADRPKAEWLARKGLRSVRLRP